MENTRIYLAGEFIETGQTLKVNYPYNGELFATTYKAGKEELEKAILAAQQVRDKLIAMPSFKRYEVLMHIKDRLTEMKETFAQTITAESGKPIKNARNEVERSIGIFTIAAEECKRLPGEYMSLDWTPAGKGKEGIIKYFPVGIVAGISPFNFPLNLSVHKIAPALAAGCPIILKPASQTPLSTLLLASIIDETDLPDGALSVLPMDRETGNLLVTDDRISLLSFTGSPEVGWKMKADAGKKKVVLELGGNAGVIIAEDSNIGKALSKCLTSAFAYSGQVCIHTQRIFVHHSLYKDFLKQFASMAEKLNIGDPQDETIDMSVMIDKENAQRVESWVKEAVEHGAKLVLGGKRTDSLYAPTILTNTNNSMKVCSHEVFGPVVTIESYKNFDEAIKMMNDTRFGLQAGVFTNRVSEMYRAFNELHVGGVIHNDVPTFRADHMPYGGIKDSGLGREGVKYAIHDMMEARILVVSQE